MKVYLIRHGKTKENMERRYVGSTDVDLCREGIEELESLINSGIYPKDLAVFVSPMARCRGTAHLIFGVEGSIINELRELHFGDFENKNHAELENNPDYIAFLNGGEIKNGENMRDFKARCIEGFESVIKEGKDCAIVCHGGVIMAIMEHIDNTGKTFYDFMVENGRGYVLEIDETVKILEKLGE